MKETFLNIVVSFRPSLLLLCIFKKSTPGRADFFKINFSIIISPALSTLHTQSLHQRRIIEIAWSANIFHISKISSSRSIPSSPPLSLQSVKSRTKNLKNNYSTDRYYYDHYNQPSLPPSSIITTTRTNHKLIISSLLMRGLFLFKQCMQGFLSFISSRTEVARLLIY